MRITSESRVQHPVASLAVLYRPSHLFVQRQLFRIIILTLVIAFSSAGARANTAVLKNVTTTVRGESRSEFNVRSPFIPVPGDSRSFTQASNGIFANQVHSQETATSSILSVRLGNAPVSDSSFSVRSGSGGSRENVLFITATAPKSALLQFFENGSWQFVNYILQPSSERAMLVLLGLTFGAIGLRAARQH